MPRCLNLHINCDVQLSQQFPLAVDALAAMVQHGSVVHSLLDRIAYRESVKKLRCISVDAQLAADIFHCHSGILLGVGVV